MNNPSQALANVGRREAPRTAVEVAQSIQPELRRALPKGLDADRIARLALTLIKKDQKLAESSPASFAGALLTAAALGLEPGLNNEAHLVAYKGECTLIIGYGGMAKLFWASPLASHLDAQAVYERDEFDYAYGLDPHLTHKPAQGDRGKITHYYAVAVLTTGAKSFVVLTAEEAKALRGKAGTNGGIKDPMHWMERKTALRQLFKLIPKSTDLQRAMDADERSGNELQADLVQQKQITSAPAPAADPETGEVLTGEIVDDDPQQDVPEPEGWS